MKKKVSGFTMIELTVAIAIIGILAAITSISMVRMTQDSRSRDQVRALQGFMNKARNNARNHRNCVQLTFAGGVVTAEESDCAGNVLATSSKVLNLLDLSAAPTIDFTRVGELSTPATVEFLVKSKNSPRSWRMRIRGMVGMTELVQ